jgi:hypothetical protein
MGNYFGLLAFYGLIVAQVLAVIAMRQLCNQERGEVESVGARRVAAL